MNRLYVMLASLGVTVCGIVSPAIAQTDPIMSIGIPPIPDTPYTTWTHSNTYATALVVLKDLQMIDQANSMLKNQGINMHSAPGLWQTFNADFTTLQKQINGPQPAKNTSAAQQKQLNTDLAHINTLRSSSDSTLGTNDKLDLIIKYLDELLVELNKERALSMSKATDTGNAQTAQHNAMMGTSGSGTYRSW